jgi:hypothetical protein
VLVPVPHRHVEDSTSGHGARSFLNKWAEIDTVPVCQESALTDGRLWTTISGGKSPQAHHGAARLVRTRAARVGFVGQSVELDRHDRWLMLYVQIPLPPLCRSL